MGVHPDVEKHRSYRVDILASSERIRPRVVSGHAEVPNDLGDMEPNNFVVLGFEENAHAAGKAFDMAFHLEEKLEGAAIPVIERNPQEDEVPEGVAAAITQKFEEYVHHKKRIDKYLSLEPMEQEEDDGEPDNPEKRVEEIFKAAHAFYAALYKDQYTRADHFVNADGTIKELREVNQGLLRGFLYGAAAEIISSDRKALNVWLNSAANMTQWFSKDNLTELAQHLTAFYGDKKKPFTADPTLPREEKGIFIAWARFFAEKDSKGESRWWKGSTADFFKYAAIIRKSGISESLYGKAEFDINNPQDMGIMINWARFIQKNGIEKFNFALEILKVAKQDWKQLGEGEVAFFVEYIDAIIEEYKKKVTLKDIFSNIQKAQKARDKAVDKLMNDWASLDLYWATEEERNAILLMIRTNLAKQGLTQEKAVYLGSKHMLSQGYSEEDLINEQMQEIFYQAVYMVLQRDATGASMMLTDGQLGELVSRNKRERYGMETVGKLIKFESMYRSQSGRFYDQIENGAEIRWINPKTGLEEVRFRTPKLGREAARAFPTSSPGQTSGFATEIHQRELEHRKALRKQGVPEGEIGNILRYWAQSRFDNTFADMLWLQTEEYQMTRDNQGGGRFLPWSMVSSFLYEVRQEDYNPLNVVELQRAHAKFQTDYNLNIALMNLDRPGFDGNLLSLLWYTWKAISGEVLVFPNAKGDLRPGDSKEQAERSQLYLENLRLIAKELELQGYSPGQIQGKQVEFLEKVNAVRQQSENLLGLTLNPAKVTEGALAAIHQKVSRLEKSIVERLRRTVIDNDLRYEKSRYVTLLYSTANQVLSSGYEARIRAERIQRARQLRDDLKKPGFRQDLFVRLEEKVKQIQKGDVHANEADSVNFLISRVNILIDKMATEGLSEEEVLEHYVRLNRAIEQDYKKLFKRDLKAELLEDELGVTGYYAGPIARIAGLESTSPLRAQYEAALRDGRRKTLETDIRRFKAEGETNPHASAWVDELQLELGQIDQMSLTSWKNLELERLQIIFAMARHIQEKFKEVDVKLSDKEAQIMAYNAFAGSLHQKNIDDWVATIKQQVDLWLETVKELKLANPELPLEEIMYYADQWLELHLADPLRVKDAGAKPEEREANRNKRVKALRTEIFKLFKTRANLTLTGAELDRLAGELDHRSVSLSSLAILIDKGIHMLQDINRIRDFESKLPISDPLKAPQQSYHLSLPLELKDVLVYLDNLNTNPQAHVGLVGIFKYSSSKIEDIQIPINAAYRLEMILRMKFSIPREIWDRGSRFAKWMDSLREAGVPSWGVALIAAFPTTILAMMARARIDRNRFEDTTRPPVEKLPSSRPGLIPPHEQRYESWAFNLIIHLFMSIYWIHFIVINYMLTLDHTYFSPLVFTVIAPALSYLFWPKVVLFIQARIMWYMAAIRGTIAEKEDETANNPDGTIAQHKGLMTITGVHVQFGSKLEPISSASKGNLQTAIKDAIKLLADRDDAELRTGFAMAVTLTREQEALVRAGALIKTPGMSQAELDAVDNMRKDFLENFHLLRNSLFAYINNEIDELVKDPAMNASVRARLHPVLRLTGYPKPEIWFDYARFVVEQGEVIPIDENFSDDFFNKLELLEYTQAEPRTNPANVMYLGSKPLPPGVSVMDYSQPMSEIMDLTKDSAGKELPQMAALGANWSDRYRSLEAIRANFHKVKRELINPIVDETRELKEKLSLLEETVKNAGGVWRKADSAKKAGYEKQLSILDIKGGDLMFDVLMEKVELDFPHLQILDVGNKTTHHDMATLVRVMSASQGATFQAVIKYRQDIAKQTLFGLAEQSFPQDGLIYTIIMQPFFFRDKQVTPFQKMLLVAMFPAFMAAGFGIAGWLGVLAGTIAAHLVLMWVSVGRAPTDSGGDIRPGGKYAVKLLYAFLTLLRPYMGAKPGKKKSLWQSFANLVRWLNTYPSKPGDPIGEDELVGLATSSTVLRLSEAKAREAGLSEEKYP
ncbi:MAG: hypothetical protein KBC91_04500, partial [Candidatus Omnitrophica bacterium]|nr:hypothetical protein [Candidatus Omnitrophota bacterium]